MQMKEGTKVAKRPRWKRRGFKEGTEHNKERIETAKKEYVTGGQQLRKSGVSSRRNVAEWVGAGYVGGPIGLGAKYAFNRVRKEKAIRAGKK